MKNRSLDHPEAISRSIVEFVTGIQSGVLNIFNKYKVAPVILRVEDKIHPNIWGEYLTANLRQKALTETRYRKLSDVADYPIFVKNGDLEEGFKDENISGRPVLLIDLSYSARMYDYCQQLYGKNVSESFYIPVDHRRIYPCKKSNILKTTSIIY